MMEPGDGTDAAAAPPASPCSSRGVIGKRRGTPRTQNERGPPGAAGLLAELKWKFSAVMIRGCGSTRNLANGARPGDLQIRKLHARRIERHRQKETCYHCLAGIRDHADAVHFNQM